MKRSILLAGFILVLLAPATAQKIVETTVKRFSVGTDIFTDIWMNKPEGVKVRTINQGANVFGMYNFPFGESKVSFALGIGMGFNNLYTDSRINDIKADTIVFTPIPDSLDYKKSKLGLSYIDIPFELRIKTDKKFRASVGFKVGYLVDAKTKYKGERPEGGNVIEKEKQVNQLEKWRYGPIIRVGYSWIHVMAYYSLSEIFQGGRGPELYPISVGITLMPF